MRRLCCLTLIVALATSTARAEDAASDYPFTPGSFTAANADEESLDDPSTTLWYSKPAGGWQTEALPIGNGRLGAMIFGGVGHERIALNEESVWSGSRAENNRADAAKNLPEIRRLLLEGKNAEAEALVNDTFTCQGAGSGRGGGARVPFGCYHALGDLNIVWKSNANRGH